MNLELINGKALIYLVEFKRFCSNIALPRDMVSHFERSPNQSNKLNLRNIFFKKIIFSLNTDTFTSFFENDNELKFFIFYITLGGIHE